MNGKGDRYRSVDKDKFDSNWDLIFGNKPLVINNEDIETELSIILEDISNRLDNKE